MQFNIDAEQSVLSACLCWPEAYPTIQRTLTPGDFYRADHRLIFRAIECTAEQGKPIDVVTVAEFLEASKQLEKVGGLAYVSHLADIPPAAVNAPAYAEIVRRKAVQRQVSALCADIAGKVDGAEVETLIAELQAGIDGLTHSGIGSALDWVDVLARTDEAIEEAARHAAAGTQSGVMTGLPALDRRIGGLPNKRLIILAGRPSLGKSALAQQIVLHCARHDHPVGICSLEMSADEIGIRSYANVLGVNGTGLQFGDRSVITAWTEKLRDHPITRYPIFIDDATYSLAGIIARAHEWKHKHQIRLLIVDHIGLVDADGDSANERLGAVTRSLKKLAKRLDIPVLAVCQLNRSVEREKRRPKLSDLRDSGNIEQDCDVALFLHADDENGDEDGPVNVEIGALKTRYGRRGWLPQQFQFDGRTQRFIEVYQHAA